MSGHAANVEENMEVQAEELEVLESIYGPECHVTPDRRDVQINLWEAEDGPLSSLKLCAHLVDDYPAVSAPALELEALWLSAESRDRAWHGLQEIWTAAIGEVVIFKWVEWLKEQDWLAEERREWMESQISALPKAGVTATEGREGEREGERGPSKGRAMPPPSSGGGAELLDEKGLEALEQALGIIHGMPFTEKKSTFQAHLARVSSVDEVEGVMEALLQNRKVAAATHNIMAYRILVPNKGTVLQDYDDDGEAAAGGRLLHLLQIIDAKNVVVVVSRWYGGILLGPARFQHINNAARSLLSACGLVGSSTSSGSKSNTASKGKRR